MQILREILKYSKIVCVTYEWLESFECDGSLGIELSGSFIVSPVLWVYCSTY